MALEFRKAVRKSVPMLISISSVSGGGKTFSALLMAAGIAGKTGRVGFIDTENGRGEMYADSPGIVKALPNGYDYLRMDPPFSPDRYREYIAAAEQAGITVCVVDSGSHEWEGIGGCTEIAEKNPLGRMPNWSRAKIEHKRFVNHLLSSSMHLIICLRAREKVKVFKKGDALIINPASPGDAEPAIAEKDCIVPIGLQPICEKAFSFEMLVSLLLDERTHHAIPIKVPEPLQPLFTGGRMLTKEDGERIRQWNDGGASQDAHEQLLKRSRAAAEDGMAAYKEFYGGLTKDQKTALAAIHAQNKAIAEQADKQRALPEFPSLEAAMDAGAPTEVLVDGVKYAFGETNYQRIEG